MIMDNGNNKMQIEPNDKEVASHNDESINNNSTVSLRLNCESMDIDQSCEPVNTDADESDLSPGNNLNSNVVESVEPIVSPEGVLNTGGDSSWTPRQTPIKLEEMDDTEDIYDEGDESKPSGTIELRITNISQFKDQILSEPTMIRCLPWKILFMNRCGVDRAVVNLGFFVQCNGESSSTTWNCNARAELRIVAQHVGGKDIVRNIEHNFFYKENDWGYATFITLNDLVAPEKGFVRPEDDSVLLRVKVYADAPHGVNWNSKLHTGFVGLKNQGATCYMNSLLQALYCTNRLRRAVYLMPTDSDDTSRSVPLALQRVFYELQHSEHAVGTKKLTRSFGWETLDSFMQHDAQELCRVLMDNMESKMKGTSVEEVIPNLFRGRMMSYIRCKHVDFASKREENFYDIQLKVKGNLDIYQAFDEYVAKESLDQDNKYDAGEFGMQEAEKGVTFLKFPPVLYLQLMRFQYDHIADANIKINDRFDFPYHLDLSRYLESNYDSPTTFFLHAVLVHSGDNHGGHYVAYINPSGDNKWFKFDDDVVSRCSIRQAIHMNYGGDVGEDLGIRLSNAYMLVYIAESAKDEVLCPVSDDDIPETLKEKFMKEQKIEADKKREKAEAHLYGFVTIFLDEDFDGWQGYDLYNPDTVPQRKIRVLKSISQQTFIEHLSETLSQPPQKIRPWTMALRKNQTQRPTYMDLSTGVFRQESNLCIWVQCLAADDPQAELPPFDMTNDLLFFLKYFDPKRSYIHYCGTITIRMRSQISTILPELRRRAGLPPDISLLLFEEIKHMSVELIPNLDAAVENCVCDVIDGNIIVFQPEDINKPTASDYFRDLYYRVDVMLLDKSIYMGEVNNPPACQNFILKLSSRMNYWTVADAVARYLNIDKEYIQFFKIHPTSQNPRDSCILAIRCNFEGHLKDMLSSGKGIKRLLYQRLTIPITEIENMKQLRCIFVTPKLKEHDITFNLNRTCTVEDLLKEANQKLEIPPNGSGQLRLMEVMSSKIAREFPGDFKLANLPSGPNRTLRIEEVPLDEVSIEPDETVIYVAHFHRDSFSTFGVPFTLKIKDGESFSAVRERIRRRLDVSEKEFEKWRFAVISTRVTFLPDNSDTAVRINHFINAPPAVLTTNENSAVPSPMTVVQTPLHTSTRPWLGLEHKFPPKRPRYNLTEKPIKIHN